ncbi:MAG TPA: AMMECR1 domain-containing protein, partial [Gammaproteobacteria bacterium]
ILEEGHYYRGTFLPTVWSSLPDPSRFLAQLKQKAGLAPDYWSDTIRIYRYTTESFPEDV